MGEEVEAVEVKYRPEDTAAFMWAYERLEGWGQEVAGKHRTWTLDERIRKAQVLAGVARIDPLGFLGVKAKADTPEDPA